ncbi:protein ABHD11 [Neodiprion lecontei]|uniref:sn-1-specific diacylglycerol lipase ABHD11 n=1 Tax=Neodiprion lecontei TaxID=441921 RepID=A0A6J0C7H8_NEOLC|nr:protein ABHD11 [Neodiprion lecontei]XP_046591440.1 protein ABHD11 [Neodiprion lecontei]
MIFVSWRNACMKYPTECRLKTLALLRRRQSFLNRQLYNTPARSAPVKLAYAAYESTSENPSTITEAPAPIIIIHGLFGSKNNWNSLSKVIHQRTSRKVIAVDARNHGDSPHSSDSTYAAMVDDIVLLVKDLGIKKAVMVGHSMGGRVMMYLALTHPELVEKLVSIDVSPTNHSPSLLSMVSLFDAMKNVKLDENVSLFKARKMTDQQLSDSINSAAIRQFLLTNLVEAKDGKYKWRLNLPVLEKHFNSDISRFPATDKTFNGPTLFIGGDKSDYITVEDHVRIKRLFPEAKIQYIPGAGHWVHSEKPKEFLDIITSFINEAQ